MMETKTPNQTHWYLLTGLVRKGAIEQTGAEIKISGHTVTLQVNEQEMEQKIGAIYREAGLAHPSSRTCWHNSANFRNGRSAR